MARTYNTCDGTIPNAVTTSNSAGPDQFTVVSAGSGSTIRYDTQRAKGRSGVRFTTTTNTAHVRLPTPSTSRLHGHFWLYFSSISGTYTTSTSQFLVFRDSVGTRLASLDIAYVSGSGRSLQFNERSVVTTPTYYFSQFTWYYFMFDFDFTNGGALNLYPTYGGDTILSAGNMLVLNATADAPMAGTVASVDIGFNTASVDLTSRQIYVDDLIFSDTSMWASSVGINSGSEIYAQSDGDNTIISTQPVVVTANQRIATITAQDFTPEINPLTAQTIPAQDVYVEPLAPASVNMLAPAAAATLPTATPAFDLFVNWPNTMVRVVVTGPTSVTLTSDVLANEVTLRPSVDLDDGAYTWHAEWYDGSAWTAATDSRAFTIDTTGATGAATYDGSMLIDASTPALHLWFADPPSAEVGDDVTLYGHGFTGTVAATVAGVAATTAATSTVSASSNAYTADRQINPLSGVVDPQHHTVVMTVPEVSPPGGALIVERT